MWCLKGLSPSRVDIRLHREVSGLRGVLTLAAAAFVLMLALIEPPFYRYSYGCEPDARPLGDVLETWVVVESRPAAWCATTAIGALGVGAVRFCTLQRPPAR